MSRILSLLAVIGLLAAPSALAFQQDKQECKKVETGTKEEWTKQQADKKAELKNTPAPPKDSLAAQSKDKIADFTKALEATLKVEAKLEAYFQKTAKENAAAFEPTTKIFNKIKETLVNKQKETNPDVLFEGLIDTVLELNATVDGLQTTIDTLCAQSKEQKNKELCGLLCELDKTTEECEQNLQELGYTLAYLVLDNDEKFNELCEIDDWDDEV
ncbi:MAG: hypothetical protein HYY16_02415 [Planctomycetes bacterium]|nr:hypothetical protein [Planctomycetota bacterium]